MAAVCAPLEFVLQTTILGLAIALILALVTALVGPLLIDWGSYRSVFEKEASRLAGLDVHVRGPIDARLLPTPELTLRDIDIGAGEGKVRATSLGVEFALGPLLRGEWRATQLRLVGPQLRLGLDAAGQLKAPNAEVTFSPDALAIDRLTIQDGTLTLFDDASNTTTTLDRLSFEGDARSLLGPYAGEGRTTVNGELYPFRLAVGRYSEGRLKLRVNVDPVQQPFSVEAQGTLTLAGGRPEFDGTASFTRPVAIALRGSHALSQPWRLSGKLKANPSSALLQDVAFDYGSPDRGFRLNGVADLKFGKNPRFNAVLSARQIDVDRAVGENGPQSSPRALVSKLAQMAGGAFRPRIPIQIGIGIDQATIGGDILQNLRGDISASAQGWNLDRFEFRAPGFTDVRLSGRLSLDESRPVFQGPIEVRANNPMVLAAWMEGRSVAAGTVKPLGLQGRLTLAEDRVALEDLAVEFDRKFVNGRFVYVFGSAGKPAQLDATLRASELDVDGAFALGNSILAGSPIERPHDITLTADIERATIAGFPAKDAKAQLKVSSQGLQIDRLSVADLGGAAFSASGRIVTAPPSPQGSLTFDLDAPDMTPVVALLSRYAPQSAEVLQRKALSMAPAKLHGTLTMQGATFAAEAKVAIAGKLGETRVNVESGIKTDLTTFEPGDVSLHATLAADNGAALLGMLGLGGAGSAAAEPGELTIDASGPLQGEWLVNGKLKAGGFDGSLDGKASPLAEERTASLRAVIARADVRTLAGGESALPVSASANLALKGNGLTVGDLDANVAGSAVRGRLALTLSNPYQVEGDIQADHADGARLVALAIGMPAPPERNDAPWHWSSEPFGAGLFGTFVGTVKVAARQVDLLPGWGVKDFRTTLKFTKEDMTAEDMAGELAGGQLSGSVSFRASNGVRTMAKVALSRGDAAQLPPLQQVMNGKLAVSGEVEGAGLTPVALMGSLHGSAKVTLQEAAFADLNPGVFEDVARAVDDGLAIDQAKIAVAATQALAKGKLSIKKADGDLVVDGGQVRLEKFTTSTQRAGLSIAGNLALTDGSINGRLVLSGLNAHAGTRPDIFMAVNGSVIAPERSLDVSGLMSWLTLRAVERQTKQLQEMERSSKAPPTPSPIEVSVPVRRDDVVLPPKRPAAAGVTRASAPATKRQRAPQLPAPVEIGVAPKPGGAGSPPSSSVGQQN